MTSHHLWPIWRPGEPFWLRIRWIAWRWWTAELRLAYRRRTCHEHIPMSVRAGTLRALLDGDGHQRVLCAYCGVLIRDFD